MGLSVCNTVTDLHDQELSKHGDAAFPIACYADDLCQGNVPWHWHEEWEIVLVTEGCLCFDLENARQTLACGDGVFLNGKAMHAIQNSTQTPGKLHSAVFHPRLIGGSMDSVFWQTLVQPFYSNAATRFLLLKQEIPWQKEVLRCFEAAWEAIAGEQDDFENLARYSLSKAVRGILRNTDFSKSNLSEQELTKINRIRSMMEFIEFHYMEELTVEQIAKSVSVSNSACLRCFHEMLNTTPMQYVMETRLKKAAAQLRATNKSAKDIALDCGFNDASYFTKLFRLKYGCTPGNYRKSS
ncbi:MAG: AraC family transcriptional regulator [Lachnospiraceae bacterium]|nr:AraC family transcriptional regulator [Lachnospiraceae bacterium]